MDPSLTQIQTRCLWKFLRFCWSELMSARFTNVKAWLLAFGGLKLSTYLNANGYFTWIPCGLWWISLTSFFFATYALAGRLVHHYQVYFRVIHCD